MGKTKIKIIDDSAPVEETKKAPQPKKTSKKEEDSLIAKLNAELGIEGKETTDGRKVEDRKKLTIRSQPSTVKKSQKPGTVKPNSERSSRIRSKKYQEVIKDLDRTKTYPIPEAIDIVKKISYAKFDGTLEAHINTAQTGLAGLVSLPFASGKKLRILAFGQGVEDSGASIFGDDSTLLKINQGKINFDIVITTPEWMPKLAKVAKVLGPKGLMPNPKNGTITDSSADGLKKVVESFKAGKTEYKTEAKAPIIHLGLGKLSQPTEQLSQNVKTLLQTLGKSKIKKVSLSPTMGPSVKLDLSSI